ncbi:MAG TPA: heavy metal-associated domain-containing protein [Fibrobacteria bacterium]|nr:heavy metal-associated domain-containing protein [Fibrobacteria bacterium]
MESLNLRIGGMESRKDVQLLGDVLETLPGIEAYDVKPGRVRVGYLPGKVSLSAIFAALAEAGEGYDVEMD